MSTKLFVGADGEIYLGSGQRLFRLQRDNTLDLVMDFITFFKYHKLTINVVSPARGRVTMGSSEGCYTELMCLFVLR